MIDHLGGGQRFVDLLSLARKIDQELHAVGLDVAVFAHEANYLFVSFARTSRIHPQSRTIVAIVSPRFSRTNFMARSMPRIIFLICCGCLTILSLRTVSPLVGT